jgi:hypothetical protein
MVAMFLFNHGACRILQQVVKPKQATLNVARLCVRKVDSRAPASPDFMSRLRLSRSSEKSEGASRRAFFGGSTVDRRRRDMDAAG